MSMDLFQNVFLCSDLVTVVSETLDRVSRLSTAPFVIRIDALEGLDTSDQANRTNWLPLKAPKVNYYQINFMLSVFCLLLLPSVSLPSVSLPSLSLSPVNLNSKNQKKKKQ